MKKTLILLGFTALLAVACRDKSNENETINKCTYSIMKDYYLWNDFLPSYNNGDDDPGDFFESLLYKAKDHWSFCVEDGDAYMAQLAGSPYSMGYSPQFWYYNNKKNVLIVVEYVYPGSPADRAGLKRGDIILDIDGEPMTPDNYYDLYSKDVATYSLADNDPIAQTLTLNGKELKMKAEVVKADPSIYDTIFNVGGRSVGYYVYTAFTSDVSYYNTMDEIFDRFKAAGVKDLILDLRYNGGGDVDAAGHLASAIAPKNVVENNEVLITNVYNSLLTYEFQRRAPEDMTYHFPKNSHNADIENLYVLCTEGTASASELVIVGLMPYMNVKLIGTNTYGKYTGMFVFHKSVDKELEDLKNWVLMPVCMKYANSQGYTDFDNGLTPDYTVVDDLTNAYQFGDANDPMLAAAFDAIGGEPLTTKAARIKPYVTLGRDRSVVLNNLIVRPKKMMK